MGTKQLIIYAEQSGMVRRIVTDDADRLDGPAHCGPGETFVLTDKQFVKKGPNGEDIPALYQAIATVESIRGVKSEEMRHAQVEPITGKVVAIVNADPALDKIEGYDLIPAYDGVTTECVYAAKEDVFIAPIVVIPAGTLDHFGNPIPEDIVTGGPIPKPKG